MNTENLSKTMQFLASIIKSNYPINEKEKLKYLYNELENIKNKLPTEEKINELRKIVIDLEVKYDVLNEFSYYFDPFYVEVKRKIHEEYVKEIREKNKEKRMKN